MLIKHVFGPLFLCKALTIKVFLKAKSVKCFRVLLGADPILYLEKDIINEAKASQWIVFQKVTTVNAWTKALDPIAFIDDKQDAIVP